MTRVKLTLTAGFAMFAMFFGSGNLIYPLLVGIQSGVHYPYAFLGFILTAVFVPFLGLVGMILYQGNRDTFFETLGKVPAWLLIFMMLALMGPFGVLPRCILVAYGGMKVMFPSLALGIFSFVFCLVTLAIAWNHDRFVNIIGQWLTPVLIASIVFLIGAGFWLGEDPQGRKTSAWQAFTAGLGEGYQTMDLLAAFFFSMTTVLYLRSCQQEAHLSSQDILRLGRNASLIGATLLALVYGGFVTLGAQYAADLFYFPPEQLLVHVAHQALGPFALPVVSSIILLACLTTAIVLTTLFADFIKDDMFQGRLPYGCALILTLLIGYAFSLLGFTFISRWIAMALEFAYPALIILTLSNIFKKGVGLNLGYSPFWLSLAITAAFKFFR